MNARPRCLSLLLIAAAATLSLRAHRPAPLTRSAAAPPAAVVAIARALRYGFHEAPAGFRASSRALAVRATLDRVEVRPRESHTAMTFATRAISRGARRIDALATHATVATDGSLRIARGAVVTESLANEPTGLEQSWLFASRPQGDGDVVVRIAIDGADYRGETEHGLHFATAGAGVRYGRAVFIDAVGTRTAVEATMARDEIALRVPSNVIDGARYPSVLDPVISAEFTMDAPAHLSPANRQIVSDVAFDGTNYLVVWEDFRTSSYADIFGTRLSPAGVALDPAGIAISTAANSQANPEVAFDGSNYLVAWEDARGADLDIYAARVTRAGAVLDAMGIPVVTAAGNQDAPAVSFNGMNYLVAWEDTRNGGYDIFASRVSPAGSVLDSGPRNIRVAAGAALEELPATASDGNNYLVVWTDYRTDAAGDLYGGRVSAAGALLDGTGLAIAQGTGEQTSGAVTYGNPDYFVVWQDGRASPGFDDDVYGARVSATLTVRDPSGIAIATGAPLQTVPAVAFNGVNYVVAWQENTGGGPGSIHAGRIAPSGSVLDAMGFVVSADARNQAEPSIASAGGGASMVAYRHFDNTATIATDRIRARSITGDQPLGTACGNGNICNTGICVDGVCCNMACGNGDTTDCQACSIAAGGTRDGTCGPIGTAHVCRAQNGVCDVPETCDGSSFACPADGYATTAVTCRPQNGECDVAESCTGGSPTCPPDGLVSAGTLCRDVAGNCDVAETCTGTARYCPPDGFAAMGLSCRDSIGPCDAPEFCTGTMAACPVDLFNPGGFQCRAPTGPCDQGGSCTGASASCPPNQMQPSGVVCREPAGPCDSPERCDGTTGVCPPDTRFPAGTMCYVAAGPCDSNAVCDGTSNVCPPPRPMPASVECRPAAGPCDLAEHCTGFSATCPTDRFYSAGFMCRASAGVCDVAESCSGVSAQCPPDVFLPPITQCRVPAGPCDNGGMCSGSSATCPANMLKPAGMLCRNATGPCDQAGLCDGVTSVCPPDAPTPAGTTCNDHDPCTAGDVCDGHLNCNGQPVHCADGRTCTPQTCCAGLAASCDSHDPCILDSCATTVDPICTHQRYNTMACVPHDAGTDAAVDDGSSTDAQSSDVADASSDGGADGSGTISDGAPSDADGGTGTMRSGCGCRVAGERAPAGDARYSGLVAFAALAIAARSRRRRARAKRT